MTGTVLEEWPARGSPKLREYLLRLLEAEQASRQESRRQRLLRAARLPALKTLEGYDWSVVRFPADYGREAASHRRSFVVGVDTHARTLTFVVLTAAGEHLDTQSFPNTHAGRSRALGWAARRTGADLDTLWVIEGIGSYGAQIARQAALAGYRPVEAPSTSGKGRRGLGKSDPIDARRIAAAVLPLSEEELHTPRMDEGVCAAAGPLLAARGGLTTDRTRAVNSLTARVPVTDLGIDARVRKTSQRRPHPAKPSALPSGSLP